MIKESRVEGLEPITMSKICQPLGHHSLFEITNKKILGRMFRLSLFHMTNKCSRLEPFTAIDNRTLESKSFLVTQRCQVIDQLG